MSHPQSNAIRYCNIMVPTASPERLLKCSTTGAGNLNLDTLVVVLIQVVTTIFSSVDRIDYSNDTATASPKGNPLECTGKRYLQPQGNTTFGYFAGGDPSSFSINIINSRSVLIILVILQRQHLKDHLTGARYNHCATTVMQHFGYFGGGKTPTL